MSDKKDKAEIKQVQVTLDEALSIIEDNKKEIQELKEDKAKLTKDLDNANSTIDEWKSLMDAADGRVSELEDKLANSSDAEKDKLIEELNRRIGQLEGNQSNKHTLVKDTEGKTYKLKVGAITVDGEKYTSAQLSTKPDVVDALVKMGSGFLSLTEE